MNTFYYKATDRLGKPIEGNLEAHDYQNAVAQIRGLNYFPIQVSDNRPDKNFSISRPLQINGLQKKISSKELLDSYEVKDVIEMVGRFDSYFKLTDAIEQYKTSKSLIDFEVAITKFIFTNYVKQLVKNLPNKMSGNIINIVDQRVVNLTPFFTTYTLTKSMLWTLTQTLALSLAPKIKVNAIGPGPTFPSKRQTSKQFKNQYRKVPLKKAVDPNEIAEAILFILNSNSLTGQLINIDSGQHLGWAHANNKKIIDE